MSFVEKETSVAEGQPITLYAFNRGAQRWLYTNADRDIPYGGETYKAVAISDEGVTQSGQVQAETFNVALPTRTDLVALYHGTPPSDSVFLTVRHLHASDIDGDPLAGIAPVQFVGLVEQVSQDDAARSEIVCQSLLATLNRDGLRLGWERSCPHTLYDQRCKVDKAAFVVPVQAITGLTAMTITAPEIGTKEDGWFNVGFIEWDVAPGVVERRPIELHLGDTITLLAFTDGLHLGSAIRVYPGCSRHISVCQAKFNNRWNYGGFPHLPGDSPFNGNPVF